MTEEQKREQPENWRPYPPIKPKIGTLVKALKCSQNYLTNLAWARMTGVPDQEIEKYKRENKDEQDD